MAFQNLHEDLLELFAETAPSVHVGARAQGGFHVDRDLTRAINAAVKGSPEHHERIAEGRARAWALVPPETRKEIMRPAWEALKAWRSANPRDVEAQRVRARERKRVTDRKRDIRRAAERKAARRAQGKKQRAPMSQETKDKIQAGVRKYRAQLVAKKA
jgi:hypothetical protein